MAVAFDAVSEYERTGSADPITWTHTSSAAPRGVIVAVTVNGGSASAIASTTATWYGNVQLRKVAGCLNQGAFANDTVSTEIWFAGGSALTAVPAGTATVQLDTIGTLDRQIHCTCITLTANGNTEPTWFSSESSSTTAGDTNTSITVQKDGRTGFAFMSLGSARDAPEGTLLAGNTAGPSQAFSATAQMAQTCYETTPDASDHAIGWTGITAAPYAYATCVVSEMQKGVVSIRQASATSNVAQTSCGGQGISNELADSIYLTSFCVSGTAVPAGMTTPAGWVQIGSWATNTSGSGINQSLWYFVNGTDTTYVDTFTWSGTADSRMQTLVVTGADLSDIIAVTAVTGSGSGPVVSVSAAGISGGCTWVGAVAQADAGTASGAGFQINWDRNTFIPTTSFAKSTSGVGHGMWVRDSTSSDNVTLRPGLIETSAVPANVPWTAFLVGIRRRTRGVFPIGDFGTTANAATAISHPRDVRQYVSSAGIHGVCEGDVLVYDITTLHPSSPGHNIPSGWTQIGSTMSTAATAGTAGCSQTMLYKVLTASDLNTVASTAQGLTSGGITTFTWSGTATTGNAGGRIYRNASLGPIDIGSISSNSGSGTAMSVTGGPGARKYEAFHAIYGLNNAVFSSSGESASGFDRGQSNTTQALRWRRITKVVTNGPGTIPISTRPLPNTQNWISQIVGVLGKEVYADAANTYSFNIGSSGSVAKSGVVQLTIVDGIVTVGTAHPTSYGIVQLSELFGAQTIGQLFRRGSVTTPLVFNVATIGTAHPTSYGVVQIHELLGVQTIGKRIARGTVTFPIALNVVTAGKYTARGRITFPILITIYSAPVGGERGIVQATFGFGVASQGSYLRRGYITDTIPFNVGTIGRVGKFGQISLTELINIATSGKRIARGQITLPITLSIGTNGARGARGSITSPYIFNVGTNGARLATGSVSLPLILGLQTAGVKVSRATLGSTFLVDIETIARAARSGSVTFPIHVDIETALAGLDWTLVLAEEVDTEQLVAAVENTLTLTPLPEEIRY